MLPSAIRDRLIVDEAQLGQRLNLTIQRGHRADFRLHLALLSEAIEEQPWFGSEPKALPEPKSWRTHFALPMAVSLQGAAEAPAPCEMNECLQQGGGMVDIRLWLALRSPPIVGTPAALDPAVYDNLSALGRERWHGKLAALPGKEDPLLVLSLLGALRRGEEAPAGQAA